MHGPSLQILHNLQMLKMSIAKDAKDAIAIEMDVRLMHALVHI
jgi:hypothetical protein